MTTAVPVLVSVADAGSDGIIVLDRFPFTIGRAPGNCLSLRDARVKRNHAVIERSGDQAVIIDLQSTHRTHVNGLAIERSALQHGDVILIGRTSLVYLERIDRRVVEQAIRRIEGYSAFRRNDRPARLN